MELVLEPTQQGTSHEVSVSTEGVEEWKRNINDKGWKESSPPFTLRQKPGLTTYAVRNTSCCLTLKLVSWTQWRISVTFPSHSRSLKRFLFHFSWRYTHFYRLSHSELANIEKVAVCSSLRSLKPKRTIESRAKSDHP